VDVLVEDDRVEQLVEKGQEADLLALAVGGGVDAGHDRGEVRALQELAGAAHDDPDAVDGPAGRVALEALGVQVGAVVQLLDGLQHTRPRLRGDNARPVVDHIGDHRAGDACPRRHVLLGHLALFTRLGVFLRLGHVPLPGNPGYCLGTLPNCCPAAGKRAAGA